MINWMSESDMFTRLRRFFCRHVYLFEHKWEPDETHTISLVTCCRCQLRDWYYSRSVVTFTSGT